MKLITKELEALLLAAPLYSQEQTENPPILVKFFTPWTSWTWFVLEGQKQADGDWEFFGMVHGFEKEWSRFNTAVRRMKDIAQHAGFVALKRNVLTDDYMTLYDGKVAGLDTDGGRWSLVCEIRGAVISHPTKTPPERRPDGLVRRL